MMRWTMMAVVALVLAVGARAADGDAKKGPRPGVGNIGEMMFKRLDGDANGKLTKDEIKKAGDKAANGRFNIGEKLGDAFDKLDADKSGDLSADEFKKFGAEMRGNLGGGFGGKVDPEKLKQLRERLGGKVDPEKLKQLRERFQNRKPPEKK